MKGETLSHRKGRKEKENTGPTFEGRIPKEPRKGLDQDTLELLELRGIHGKCKKELVGIWTAQGSVLMDTRNIGRCIPLADYDSEKKLMTLIGQKRIDSL